MTDAELISMVRSIAKHGADWRINEVLNRAAAALEAADKRIAELESQMPKEGEWIEYPDCLRYEGAYNDTFIACNQCGHVWSTIDNCTETFDHCPNCGARMKKGEQENE